MIHRFSKFQQLEEANTTRAIKFESYIAQGLNDRRQSPEIPAKNQPEPTGRQFFSKARIAVQKGMPGASAKDRDAIQKIVDTILKSLNNKSIHTAQFVHMGEKKGPLSDFYIAQGATDGTSKADIRSTDNRFRFSVKNAGGAALASGSQAEQRAAFYWALNAHPSPSAIYTDVGQNIIDVVDTYMSNIPPPAGIEKHIDIHHMRTVPDSKKPGVFAAAQNPKTAWPSEITTWLNAITKRDTAMKKEIGDKLKAALSSNEDFRRYYTFEVATGQGKFGDIHLDGPWSANYMLTFDYDGRAHVDAMASPDDNIIKTYSREARFRFRWQHGAKVRVSVDLTSATLQQHLLKKEARTITEWWAIETRQLTQSLLTEGSWNDTAALWTRVKNWYINSIQKLKAAIRRAWASGWLGLLEFFELIPEDISVSWPIAK